MSSGDAMMRVGNDREQAHAVYRQLAMADCPEDVKLGLNLGFYRVFGVPSIARVLAGTGKMTGQPKARAKATGALMYAIIEHGLDAPGGREAVTALNRIHAGLPVGNEEFVYVLAAFCVTPIRWIDRHGWRSTTAAEKAAAHRFYRGLARRMGIEDVPGSYTALARWMDDYEEQHFAVTAEGQALMDATRILLTDRFPSPAARMVRAAADALLDERLRAAVGAACPPALVRALVDGALRLRARTLRRRHRR